MVSASNNNSPALNRDGAVSEQPACEFPEGARLTPQGQTRLAVGKEYIYARKGRVRLVGVEDDGSAISVVFIGRRDYAVGYLASNKSGQRFRAPKNSESTRITNWSPEDLVLYRDEVSGHVTQEAQKRIAELARARYPEKFVPLLFGFDSLLKTAAHNRRFQEILTATAREILGETLDPVEDGWWYIQKATEARAWQTFFKELFKRIYTQTGQDVVLASVLDAFGREATQGSLKAWAFPRFKAGKASNTGGIWPAFGFMPEFIDEYYRGQLLKGLLCFNDLGDPILDKHSYEEVRRTFNLSLAQYYRKSDQRHLRDQFSQLMLRLRDDVRVVVDLLRIAAPRLAALQKHELSGVDYVIPAPSLNPAFNHAPALADVVSKFIGAELTLTALTQIRQRSKSQRALTKVWRRAENAGGVFGGNARELNGKTILIVDDNETTGFTAAAMRAAAYEAGAKKVLVVSFGRTADKRASGSPEVEGIQLLPEDPRLVHSYTQFDRLRLVLEKSEGPFAISQALRTLIETPSSTAVATPALAMLLPKLRAGPQRSNVGLNDCLRALEKRLREPQENWGLEQAQRDELKHELQEIAEEYLTQLGGVRILETAQGLALRAAALLDPADTETIALVRQSADVRPAGRSPRVELISSAIQAMVDLRVATQEDLMEVIEIARFAPSAFPRNASGYKLSLEALEAFGKLIEIQTPKELHRPNLELLDERLTELLSSSRSAAPEAQQMRAKANSLHERLRARLEE